MAQQLKSPTSGTDMIEVMLRDVTIHQDPTEVGGYWLRRHALHQLSELQETPIDDVLTGETLHSHQGRFCPEDGTGLMEFEYQEHSGIKMDICPTCHGIWLDGNELNRLLNYLSEHEFAAHLDDPEDEELPLTDRVMLFLYALTANPPRI